MLALSVRQLDGSRFPLEVPRDTTIGDLKQMLSHELHDSTLTSTLTFVFSGRVCPDSLVISDYLPSISQGMTILNRDGALVPIHHDWKLSNRSVSPSASGFLGAIAKLTSSDFDKYTGISDSPRPQSHSAMYAMDTYGATGKGVEEVGTPPAAFSWAPRAPTTVAINTVLGETFVLPLRPKNNDMTILEVKEEIHASVGIPPLAQQWHFEGRVIPPSWDNTSIRCLSPSLGSRLELGLSYSPSSLWTSAIGSIFLSDDDATTLSAGDNTSRSSQTEAQQALRAANKTSFVHSSADIAERSGMCAVNDESFYGNDIKTGRLRGYCRSCGVVGAHFEPRPLCPSCGVDHEGVVITAGFLPSPRCTESTVVEDCAFVPSKSYKWKQLKGIVVKCLLCEYIGQPKIGFLCRSVKVDDASFPSDYDIPSGTNELSLKTAKFCPSRVGWTIDRPDTVPITLFKSVEKGGVSTAAEDAEDPMVPLVSSTPPQYSSHAGQNVSDCLKEAVSSIICHLK